MQTSRPRLPVPNEVNEGLSESRDATAGIRHYEPLSFLGGNSKIVYAFIYAELTSSSLSDLNVKSLIPLEFMFLPRKTKLNDINMLSITPTSSPTGC